MLTSHSAALAQVLRDPPELGTETVPLAAAAGRILRQPLYSDRPQPPFHRVSMDGIAIDFSAYVRGQRFFPRAAVQAAGQPPVRLGDASYCIEVMTGAVLPHLCSTIVPYERIRAEHNGFYLPEGIEDRKNVHRLGSDSEQGALLIPSSRRIGPAEVGMLATCGVGEVEVSRRPRVAIIATGDELVPIDVRPAGHQIRRSNLYQLRALVEPYAESVSLHHYPDEPKQMTEHLRELLEERDVILLSGGVSKGKFDFVPEVLRTCGVRRVFHRVAQRPGKPLWFGRRGTTAVFGLPGNPVSSVVSTLVYTLPLLRQLSGELEQAMTYARLTEAVVFKHPLTLFRAVALTSDPATGQLLASPVDNRGSGDGSSLLRTDGFLRLAANQQNFAAGSVHEVIRLG